MGTSGPSNSITALSIPRPANAESKCSTVETDYFPQDIVVDKRVSCTLFKDAETGISEISFLTKMIPLSGWPGLILRLILRPVCNPTPVAVILLDKVLCFNISKYYQIVINVTNICL